MYEKINKMPEFYIMIARKILFPEFWEGHRHPLPSPSPTPMHKCYERCPVVVVVVVVALSAPLKSSDMLALYK